MDFRFSEEQEMFRESIEDFLKRECPRSLVRHCDENEVFPREIIGKMAPLGWLGIQIPEEYGGMGCGAVELGLFLEQVARGMNGLAQCVYSSLIFAADYILRFGSEELKGDLLPRIAEGKTFFAFALTEPDSGSDAASLTTAAVPRGDGFVINGQKTFCSCADVADFIYTAVRTDRKAPKHKGISTFLVPKGAPGLEIRGIRKLGQKNMSLSDVFFTDTPVSGKNLVGNLNEGWLNVLHNIGRERFYLSAICVGAAQAVLDSALQYAKERTQFGSPIGHFQLIQEKLVNMQVEIDAARLLMYRAAWRIDEGLPYDKEASIAKLYGSECYMRAATQGMQIMGGYGYTMEYDMQRHFRDAKMYEIGGGTSEIQRLIIGREMGLRG